MISSTSKPPGRADRGPEGSAALDAMLRDLRLDASAPPVILQGSLSDLTPTEDSPDLVLHYPDDPKPHAIVLEVQSSIEPDKRLSWPLYVTRTSQRLDCGVRLVVIATTEEVADWCAKTIKTGHPGFDLTPIVIGPEQVPVVGEVEQACRDPELAIMSAIMHGRGPHGEQIAQALAPALQQLPSDRAKYYYDRVASSLSEEAHAVLEQEWSRSSRQTEFQQGYQKECEEAVVEGRVECIAESVLKVLAARGIAVPAARAEEIRGASEDQLDRFLQRSATAHSIDELFDGQPQPS